MSEEKSSRRAKLEMPLSPVGGAGATAAPGLAPPTRGALGGNRGGGGAGGRRLRPLQLSARC